MSYIHLSHVTILQVPPTDRVILPTERTFTSAREAQTHIDRLRNSQHDILELVHFRQV